MLGLDPLPSGTAALRREWDGHPLETQSLERVQGWDTWPLVGPERAAVLPQGTEATGLSPVPHGGGSRQAGVPEGSAQHPQVPRGGASCLCMGISWWA